MVDQIYCCTSQRYGVQYISFFAWIYSIDSVKMYKIQLQGLDVTCILKEAKIDIAKHEFHHYSIYKCDAMMTIRIYHVGHQIIHPERKLVDDISYVKIRWL